MALQRPERIAFCIEYVNLGIVKGNNDVFRRQMQAGHDTAVLCNIAGDFLAAGPPGCVNKVSLLEMRLVGLQPWP